MMQTCVAAARILCRRCLTRRNTKVHFEHSPNYIAIKSEPLNPAEKTVVKLGAEGVQTAAKTSEFGAPGREVELL
jgi:hypothetical protein